MCISAVLLIFARTKAIEVQSEPAASMPRHVSVSCLQALCRIIAEKRNELNQRMVILKEDVASSKEAHKEQGEKISKRLRETDADLLILAELRLKLKQHFDGKELIPTDQIEMIKSELAERQRKLKEELELMGQELNVSENDTSQRDADLKAFEKDLHSFENGVKMFHGAIILLLRALIKNNGVN